MSPTSPTPSSAKTWTKKADRPLRTLSKSVGIWPFAHLVGVPVPWRAVRQTSGTALLAFEHERLVALAAAGEHVPPVLAFDGFALTTAYTYLRATYEAGTNAGKRMPGIPQQQLFAQLTWKPRWAASLGGAFTLDARHLSKVHVNDGNTDAAGAHTLLGLGARLEQPMGAWTLREFIRVDNLGDRKHAGSVIVNDGNGRFFEPGAGRSVFVGVSLSRRF